MTHLDRDGTHLLHRNLQLIADASMRTANPGTIGTNDLHLAQVSTSTEDMKSRTLGSANPNRTRMEPTPIGSRDWDGSQEPLFYQAGISVGDRKRTTKKAKKWCK
jgi:hypothetical protein